MSEFEEIDLWQLELEAAVDAPYVLVSLVSSPEEIENEGTLVTNVRFGGGIPNAEEALEFLGWVVDGHRKGVQEDDE